MGMLTKKLRVVSLARNTPTSPPLHSYQYYQNMSKGILSYGAHKDVSMDFSFRREKYITKKVKVVSLARNTTGPPLHPHQILYQIISNSMGNMA